MSWKADRTVRFPVVIDKLTAGTSATDLTFDIPADLPEFWSVVESDKSNIRITDADGVTDLTWQASSWSYASTGGTATIEIDNWTPPAENCMAVIWLYTGGTDTTNEGSFTAATPRTGYVWSCGVDGTTVAGRTNTNGSATPDQTLYKSTDETIAAWVAVDGQLAKRRTAYNDRNDCEEIESITYSVTTGGADQASMYDETKVRVSQDNRVRLWLKAGADGTDYTVEPVITTTSGRVLNPRFLLSVVDADET